MRLRSVVVLLSLAVLLLPLSAAAQDTAPSAPVEAAADLAGPDAPSATFVVNSTSDSPSGNCGDGTCTLREAILESIANGSSKDTINFNIPGAGPHVITLAAALQTISQPLVINGLSEPGASCGSPKVVINGSGLAGGGGLKVTANGSDISGLVIQRFPSHGVEVNSSNNRIGCNFIGTNSAGSADLGNGGIGVFVNNGGGNEINNNVISGNDSLGIYVGGANAKDNNIHDNIIGLSAGANAALGNGEEGVVIQDASGTLLGGNVISGNNGHGIAVGGNSPNTVIKSNLVGLNGAGSAGIGNKGSGISINSLGVTIGGATAGEGNVISGNNSAGIVLDKPASLRRNVVGLNAAAAAKIGNGSYGIYIRSSNNQIGGASGANVIAGNGQDGIFVESGSGNKIQQNFIGTNSSLVSGLGNGMFGVHVYFGQNTTIGAGNTIAFNNADGVYVPDATSQGNKVTGNAIFGNGDLGIDLGTNGVTPNDGGDPDLGANGLQNFPALTSAGSDGTGTRVVGTLNSKANETYNIEFFRSSTCDPSGYGEGRTYLGTTTVTTDGSGNASFNRVLAQSAAVGNSVTATATDASGNTSEFSQCRAAVFEALTKPVLLPLMFK